MVKTLTLTRLMFLLSITLVIQLLGLPQPVTGPMVNFMLIITTLMVSATGGAVLGCLTPLLAVLRGQLPAPLAPMIPFILLANLSYVALFAWIKDREATAAARYYLRNSLAVTAAAVLKFAVLFAAARILLPLLLGRSLPPALVSIMAFPQLFTALIGGGFAVFFYRIWRSKAAAHL
ncbi:ECF transporter S component [bacterium]|nr:ECF transporter S component [bacterium]